MSAHDTCLWYPAATHTFRSCVGAIHYHQSNGICPDCGRPYEIDGAKDQAEGLRELMKDMNDIKDLAMSLGDSKDCNIIYPTSTASLWDTLKSELEAEATGHYQEPSGRWHGDALKAASARATLDRMLQMETLASVRPPR